VGGVSGRGDMQTGLQLLVWRAGKWRRELSLAVLLAGILGHSPHAIGKLPAWWPSWAPFSPAFLILWIPAGFRFTCYYYRGAYYKAFWADPINCAVGEPRKSFLGERYFPLIIQNVHRYFFISRSCSSFCSRMTPGWACGSPMLTGKEHFGIGVGTIVLTLNAVFLAMYTFGCHSLRHLIGGFLDSKSKAPTCAKAYNCVSCLNTRHMMWAWISLFWVGFTDVYIRLVRDGASARLRFLQILNSELNFYCGYQLRNSRIRRAGHRRGRRGLARGD
jgi:hypothetical protein